MTKKMNVLLLPGDGVGPEVCNEADKITVSYTHLTLPTI